jgi:hypothetical protein
MLKANPTIFANVNQDARKVRDSVLAGAGRLLLNELRRRTSEWDGSATLSRLFVLLIIRLTFPESPVIAFLVKSAGSSPPIALP